MADTIWRNDDIEPARLEAARQLGRDVAIEAIHIDLIRPGDTVFHEGKVQTVCPGNLKKDGFMGRTLRGDSYMIGYKPVLRVVMPCPA